MIRAKHHIPASRHMGPHLKSRLFDCKTILEEGGECLQLLFLIQIDVQFLILQPLIGIDADVPLPVGIDDEGIGGVFIPIGLVDLIVAVVGGVSVAREVRNGWHHRNGIGSFVPAHDPGSRSVFYFHVQSHN